jgi:osmotically inducible protein OsmC
MIRKASAVWKGGLKDGKGTVSTSSGALKELPYNFSMRFEEQPGTNPEELIGAAHAGCYSMALSLTVANGGLKLESVQTQASVSLEPQPAGGFAVTKIHLDVVASIPGATAEQFAKFAEDTKNGCPISKLLKGSAEITLSARLA